MDPNFREGFPYIGFQVHRRVLIRLENPLLYLILNGLQSARVEPF